MQSVMSFMQMFLTFGNLCIMLYAFKVFLSKPHNSLEQRVTTVEIELKEIKDSLKHGNDKFRKQENTNEVLIRSTLALVEFEMQYCLIEHKDMSAGLAKAKADLNEYLSKNHN